MSTKKAGYRVIEAFNCPRTKDCANDKCFFRKRDIFGMSVWAIAYYGMTDEEKKIQDELWSDVLWPRLEMRIGTNCYNITCLDEMFPED